MTAPVSDNRHSFLLRHRTGDNGNFGWVVKKRNTTLRGPLSATASAGLHEGIREARMIAPYVWRFDSESPDAAWARMLTAKQGEAEQEPMSAWLREMLARLDAADARKR